MTISGQAVVNFLRNAGSLGAIVVGAITAYTASGSAAATTGKITGGSVLALIGAVVQWIEHHNATAPSSAPPVSTPSSTATPPAAAPVAMPAAGGSGPGQ